MITERPGTQAGRTSRTAVAAVGKIADKVDDVSRLYAAAALGHQRPFLGYDVVRIFQGQALDGGAFRHRQAARYPVDVGELVGLAVGRVARGVEVFPHDDDHERQEHGVQHADGRENEPRYVVVLLPVRVWPVHLDEMNARAGYEEHA